MKEFIKTVEFMQVKIYTKKGIDNSLDLEKSFELSRKIEAQKKLIISETTT